MIHVRLSRTLNLQCGAFTVLVLLALTHSCRGQHHVNSPTQPIVAIVGEDVVLPSLLDPVMDAFVMTVEWTRPDLNPRFVYVWRDGVELESKKHPLYKGRTSVFTDELKLGNISLKLSKVRTSDEGRYRCFIPDLNREYIVQLVVGQQRVIGPTQPIVATVGEDVVLPSLLDPVMDAFVMTVEWTRPALNPRFVYVWRDGVELESKKHPLYKGRTSVFTDELKLGNVSLKLSKVRTSDEGRYRCFIPDLNKDSIVQLVVGAASSPEVQMTKFSSGVVLQCESTGWYPEPEVFWLDAEGNLLSAGPTETVRGPDDLYTVSSRVTVEKRHSNSFTCRVQQKKTNQTKETLIHVPDDFFADPSGSGSSLPVIIGLILSIVFVLAAAVVVWKWRQNKIRNKKHHEDEERRKHPEQELLMGPETDGKQPTEETDTVHNVDEFRAETGLQTETDEETLQREANNAQCADSEGTETQSAVRGGRTTRETETGLDKSQEETETKDAPLPTDSDQKNKEDETKSVSDNTEKLREERQTESNLQSEEEDNIQSTTDKKVAQCLKKKDKHEDQPVVETVTTNVQENEEATGLQTLIDGKTLQQEANNAQCAESEGTETQSAVRGGQTTRETETGLDKSQEETETEAATDTASLNPVSTNLNNTEETQTGTMVEERQKDNNQQTEEEEEEQHGDQPTAETVTPDVHKNEEATGPQTQIDGKTPQTEANKAEGAEYEEGQRDPVLAEGGTGNGSDKREETKTEPINEARDAPHPAKNDLNNKGDENKTVRDNTEKLREERQKDNNLQTEEEEEQHGDQPAAGTVTPDVHENEEATGPQTQIDGKTPQTEANKAEGADSEGTETQSAVRGGQTTRETETGLDKSQEETETEAATDTASLNPVSTNLNNTEDETQTGTMVEERQKDNNQQTEEEEEQHGDQPTAGTLTPDVHENKEATGPQTQIDGKTPQTEANNTKGAEYEEGQIDPVLAEGGTGNGSDKREETKTEPINEARDAPHPAKNDLNNKGDENKTVRDNTEKLGEERQKDNNLQTEEEEEEKIKCAGDETGAQSLTEEDKQQDQPAAGTVTPDVQENEEATGPQTQIDGKTPQTEANNTKGADSEGTEQQSAVRGGRTDLLLAEGGTETGSDKSQNETETQDAALPTDSDQKNKEDETESVRDNTEKLREERQKDNNQQTEEEEEKIKCAGDETGAQSLTEEDKHGEQQTAERETLRDRGKPEEEAEDKRKRRGKPEEEAEDKRKRRGKPEEEAEDKRKRRGKPEEEAEDKRKRRGKPEEEAEDKRKRRGKPEEEAEDKRKRRGKPEEEAEDKRKRRGKPEEEAEDKIKRRGKPEEEAEDKRKRRGKPEEEAEDKRKRRGKPEEAEDKRKRRGKPEEEAEDKRKRSQHHVIGPSQPIVATVGEDVVLPAHLHPATNALRVTVEWTRPDLSPRFVHVLRQGVKLMGNHPSYEGRTSLFTDELKLGNISLKLSRVRTSDEGRYRCFIPELDRDSVVQLVVGAASSPEVQVTVNSSGVVLRCESTGWYPEPEVFWLDAEGNLLSAGPTETVRGPDDLYTVSSRVTVERRHSNSFTCRVQQNHTNQTREAKIHFPDDFFADPSGSGSSLPVIIGLTLSIVFVLGAAAVVVWKWRQNKIRNKKHHEDEERRKHPEQEPLMGPETDGKQPTEETDTVHNVDEFRAETGLQTETDEETLQREANNAQCADSEGTETQSAVRGGQTTRETETGLDKSQEETETEAATETASLNPVSTNLNNTEDETQTGTMNEEATGPQTQIDGKTPQTEANNTKGADSEGTEQQSAVGGGQTDQLLAEGGTENRTETESINEAGYAPNPTDSDQNNREDETESVSDNTEKPREERLKDNKQQTKEEEEENIQLTADKKVAQCLKKKDKHEDQPVVETVTTNVQENEEATGLQTQIDGKTLQREANNAQCADSEGTETQSAVRGGQTTRETETGLDKSQEETETEAATDTASLNPVSTNLNNTEDETQTGTMVEERQKDNNQQMEEEEEQHGDQPTAGTLTPDVHKNKKATGPQTQIDGKTPQTEANNTKGADREGTEQQSAVGGGQTDQLLAEGGTETGSDKSQNETETNDAPLPTDSDQKNKEDETESVRDNTEKLREERQRDNKQQTEEEEEKIKCAGDETGAQSLTEEDKHGEQQTSERETLRDREEENLKKKLKTKERDLEKIEKHVSRLEGQMKDKEKQINEVKQQLEEVEKQTEEAERKMSSVNREEEDDKLLLGLNKKKEKLQEQLKKLEKLLEGIKKSEIVARQRKLKAANEDKIKERDLETFEKQISRYEGQIKDEEKQINEVKQQLEEVERQTEEAEGKERRKRLLQDKENQKQQLKRRTLL
ncbi:uncharacterized protein [Pagrus major]|uniref:uncharacterized protein n=1 Tax=Pagrus major TaxID=143350 RepID=UPI003CC89F82